MINMHSNSTVATQIPYTISQQEVLQIIRQFNFNNYYGAVKLFLFSSTIKLFNHKKLLIKVFVSKLGDLFLRFLYDCFSNYLMVRKYFNGYCSLLMSSNLISFNNKKMV